MPGRRRWFDCRKPLPWLFSKRPGFSQDAAPGVGSSFSKSHRRASLYLRCRDRTGNPSASASLVVGETSEEFHLDNRHPIGMLALHLVQQGVDRQPRFELRIASP